MSEIKKYYKSGCGSSFCDLLGCRDGNYVLYEDHLKAIAEAKKEGVREWLKGIKDNCEKPNVDSCATCKAPLCMYGYLSDSVIKKVEGI